MDPLQGVSVRGGLIALLSPSTCGRNGGKLNVVIFPEMKSRKREYARREASNRNNEYSLPLVYIH